MLSSEDTVLWVIPARVIQEMKKSDKYPFLYYFLINNS
jgi:hypothetical protein